jgi:DNA-directed RNA polymerase specialized sigma24 family protein
MRPEPFAFILYRRHLEGESVEELAAGLAIPAERVEQRLRAAAAFYDRQTMHSGLGALGRHLDRA